METTVTSPSGRTLHHRATRRTTPREDSEAKEVRIKATREQRVAENKEYLKNANVQAFLKAIGEAEGAGMTSSLAQSKGGKTIPGDSRTSRLILALERAASRLLRACTKLPNQHGTTTERMEWG